jgi:hypothetical protein
MRFNTKEGVEGLWWSVIAMRIHAFAMSVTRATCVAPKRRRSIVQLRHAATLDRVRTDCLREPPVSAMGRRIHGKSSRVELKNISNLAEGVLAVDAS